MYQYLAQFIVTKEFLGAQARLHLFAVGSLQSVHRLVEITELYIFRLNEELILMLKDATCDRDAVILTSEGWLVLWKAQV